MSCFSPPPHWPEEEKEKEKREETALSTHLRGLFAATYSPQMTCDF